MRRRLALAAAFLGVVASLAVLVGTGAAAAGGNGAVVNRDPYGDPHGCNLVGPNGESWLFDCTIQQVITPNGDINEYINGTITGGSPPPSSAEHVTTAQTGQPCDFVGPTFVETDATRATITPGGQISVTCRSA